MTAKEILEKEMYNWKDIAAFTLEDFLPAMLDDLVGEHAIGGLSASDKEKVVSYVLEEFGKSINPLK